MKVKTRLILLGICAVAFFIVTPYIVLYSLGYRVNFATWQIKGTGGIYIFALPEPDSVTIDSKPAAKTSLFSTSVFMQNLLPGPHEVSIKKSGYYDYQKNLPVQEKEVTKLENVILFKQEMSFVSLAEMVDYFSASPDENNILIATISAKAIDVTVLDLQNNQQQTTSLQITKAKITETIWSENGQLAVVKISNSFYFLNLSAAPATITPLPILTGASQSHFAPQNPEELFFIKGKDLYTTTQILPLIKNVVAYAIEGQTITWLSYDGFLYESNTAGLATVKISSAALPIKIGKIYEITITQGMTFLQEGALLLRFNEDLKVFEIFYANVNNFKPSPDTQKIAYFNDREILISLAENNHQKLALLETFVDSISDVHWLNNDYLVIAAGDAVIISEIDTRGNLNKITLPATLTLLQGETVAIKTPQILLRQQDKKLYLFTQKSVIVSERLAP